MLWTDIRICDTNKKVAILKVVTQSVVAVTSHIEMHLNHGNQYNEKIDQWKN